MRPLPLVCLYAASPARRPVPCRPASGEPARPHGSPVQSAQAPPTRSRMQADLLHLVRPPPMWVCWPWAAKQSLRRPRGPSFLLPLVTAQGHARTGPPPLSPAAPLPPGRPPTSAGPGLREPLPPGRIHIALLPLPVPGTERAAPPPYLGREISSPTLPAQQRSPSGRPRQGRGQTTTPPHTRAASSGALPSPPYLTAALPMHACPNGPPAPR